MESDSVASNAPEKNGEDYKLVRSQYEQFAADLSVLVKKLLDESGVRFSIIEHRCKTIESYIEKVNRPNKNYKNPIEEITDLCGIRVVLFNHDDLQKIEDIIRDEFDVDDTASVVRGENLSINEFGYVSDHYIIKVTSKRSKLPEWSRYKQFRAEVQVRTILQHAWASISHKIDYKQEKDVPKELRRRLFRVSALLELADDQFSQLISARMSLDESAQTSINQGEYNLDLNLDTLEQYIESAPEVKSLISDAESVGFELNERDKFLSECIAIATQLDLKNIQEIHDLLTSVLDEARNFYEVLMSVLRNSVPGGWTGSPSFFLSLILLYAVKDNEKAEEILKTGGWDPFSTARVASALRTLVNDQDND